MNNCIKKSKLLPVVYAYIIWLLILFPSYTKAQPKIAEAFFSNLTTDQNLPSDKVTDIVQDSTGFYWIATLEGLVKYDGHKIYSVAKYNLPNYPILANYITSLYIDKKQQLWIGTFSEGLWVLNLSNGSLNNIPNIVINNQIIAQNRILRILPFNDSLVLVSPNEGFPFTVHIQKYQANYFPFTHLTNGKKTSLSILHINDCKPHKLLNNHYWITTNKGLTCYNFITKQFKHFPYTNQSDKYKNLHEQTKSIYYTNSKELWISSWGAGILHFDIATEKWSEYLFNSLQPRDGAKNIIQYAIPKSTSELWIATNDYGPGIFNTSTQKYSFFNRTNIQQGSCLPGIATKIYTDHWQNTWFVMAESGLSTVYNNQQFLKKIALPQPVLPPNYNSVYSVIAAQVINPFTILLGLREANNLLLYYPQLNKWQPIAIPLKSTTEKTAVTNIFPIADNRYLITTFNNGCFIYNHNKQQITPITIPSLNNNGINWGIYKGCINKQMAYFGTKQQGVWQLNLLTFVANRILDKHRSIVNNRPMITFADSKNRIWVGASAGMAVLMPNGESIGFNGLNTQYTHFKQIDAFTEDSNEHIWIASSLSGILKVKLEKDIKLFKLFNKKTGFDINEPYQVYYNKQNNKIWTITENGLVKIDANNHQVEYFNKKEGVILSPAYQRMFPISNSQYLVASGKEMFTLNLNEVNHPNRKTLYISEVTVNQQPIWQKNNQLSVKPNQKYISLYVSSFNGANTQYFYRTTKNEKWIKSNGNEIVLNNLPHGKYNIEIGFSISQSLPLQPSYLFHLSILPQYWQTWWFRIIIISCCLGVVYFLYANKLNTVRREEQLKAAYQQQILQLETGLLRSQMNPHFLFNSLNSIKLLLQQQNTSYAITYLNRFSKLIRTILNHSREEIITLADELEALEMYVQLEMLRQNNAFKFQLTINDAVNTNQLMIPPLLLQPYVENAIWHGLSGVENGILTIHINEINNLIEIKIDDNGVGRNEEAILRKTNSLGTSITKQRINLFNKKYGCQMQVHITDKLNKNNQPAGTCVTITFQNKLA